MFCGIIEASKEVSMMKCKPVLVSLLLLLAACVPTPEQEIVVNKADGRLEELIAATAPAVTYERMPEPSALPDAKAKDAPVPKSEPENTLRAALGAPEHVRDSAEGTIFGGTLQVSIDADVEIPNAANVPVYTAQVRTFSPGERERITKYLFGEGPYFAFNPERSQKAMWQHTIDEYLKRIGNCDDRAYGEDFPYAEYRESNEFNLNGVLKHAADLPEPGPMQPWSGSFSDERTVIADADNRYLAFADGELILFDEVGENAVYHDGHAPKTDEERAIMQAAEEQFAQISGERYAAAGICFDNELFLKYHNLSVEDFPPEQYTVSLIRTVNGIPCYPYSAYHGSDTGMDAAGVSFQYDDPVLPERVEVLMKNGSIAAISWTCITETVRVENENVALLPFSEILAAFKRQIFRSIYLDAPENGETPVNCMVIERICLSYMKVKKKDAPKERYLLPVWDFLGYDYNPAYPHAESDLIGTKAWFSEKSLLTVNAIDGSILDRDAGY